jgi:hypothetical protein
MNESFSFSLLPDVAEVDSIVVERKPTGYINKEILRKIAIRHSVDGRWVQIEDYVNGILREFGEYIYDIIAKDNYPEEDIVILPKEGLMTDYVKQEIQELIDNKRGNATLINTTYLDPEDDNRLSIQFTFKYVGNESNETIRKVIEEFVVKKLNKIYFDGYWILASDLAVELTEKISSGRFYANDDDKVYVEPLQSIKHLDLFYIR